MHSATDDRSAPSRATKSEIVALLRDRDRSVSDLARRLSVSGTAVRRHLDQLEREGVVRESGTRRGRGRPATTYGLTDLGESRFRKHRDDVLRSLLASVHADQNEERCYRVLRDAGAHLARSMMEDIGSEESDPPGSPLDMALSLLERMGGREDVRRVSGGSEIVGLVCPLAELVRDYPGACKVVAGFVEEIVGVPVEDRCPHEGEPICLLETPSTPCGS